MKRKLLTGHINMKYREDEILEEKTTKKQSKKTKNSLEIVTLFQS